MHGINGSYIEKYRPECPWVSLSKKNHMRVLVHNSEGRVGKIRIPKILKATAVWFSKFLLGTNCRKRTLSPSS